MIVKEGYTAAKAKCRPTSILDRDGHCEMAGDLGKKLVFASLCPDYPKTAYSAMVVTRQEQLMKESPQVNRTPGI